MNMQTVKAKCTKLTIILVALQHIYEGKIRASKYIHNNVCNTANSEVHMKRHQ